jgi:AcrR family transcriptional regulator
MTSDHRAKENAHSAHGGPLQHQPAHSATALPENGGIDRRVLRTRWKLEHAFFHLMQAKGYDAVTIQEICDSAGIGRSTFYTHFMGKEDLKLKSLEHLRRELIHSQAGHAGAEPGKPMGFTLAMFEHAKAHLPAYRALLGSEGLAVSLGGIRQIITDLVRAELKGQGRKEERETKIAFIVGAFMGVLTDWLDSGSVTPPAEVDALFRRMIIAGALQLEK